LCWRAPWMRIRPWGESEDEDDDMAGGKNQGALL
jgi:hypothetical protein